MNAGGSGTGGSTGSAGGGIETGELDCTAPTGAIPNLKLTPIVTNGLSHPVDIKFAPGDNTRMYVVNQDGKLVIVKNGAVSGTFLDLTALNDYDGQERGFLSVAFHPQYPANGRFFVYYTAKSDGTMTVVEYSRSSNDAEKADPTPKQTIITQHDAESNHNGATLAFSPVDHFLYITWGDGGGGNDQHGKCGNGQNKQALLAKILRIDVDNRSNGKPYTPKGVIDGALPEVWDMGVRNPWRCSFDGCTGDFYIGDVGQDNYEEIDYEQAGIGGKNYGWRCREGANDTPTDNTDCPCNAADFTEPKISLGHSVAKTIIGGYVYRGKAIPGLRGSYLFGDLAFNRIWVSGQPSSWAFDPDANDHFQNGIGISLVSFGQDLEGEIYAVDINGGIYRVDAAN